MSRQILGEKIDLSSDYIDSTNYTKPQELRLKPCEWPFRNGHLQGFRVNYEHLDNCEHISLKLGHIITILVGELCA